MKYDDIDRVCTALGFTEGLRNIRRRRIRTYIIYTLAFKDVEEINEVYLSVTTENVRESIYAMVIKETEPEKLQDKLKHVMAGTKGVIIDFKERMDKTLNELRIKDYIESWR